MNFENMKFDVRFVATKQYKSSHIRDEFGLNDYWPKIEKPIKALLKIIARLLGKENYIKFEIIIKPTFSGSELRNEMNEEPKITKEIDRELQRR